MAYSVWSGDLDHGKEEWHDKITHEGEVVGRNHPVTGQVVPPTHREPTDIVSAPTDDPDIEVLSLDDHEVDVFKK